MEVNLDADDDVEGRCRDFVKHTPNAPKTLIIRGKAIEVVPEWLATFVQQQSAHPWFHGIQILRVQNWQRCRLLSLKYPHSKCWTWSKCVA